MRGSGAAGGGIRVRHMQRVGCYAEGESLTGISTKDNLISDRGKKGKRLLHGF